MKHMVNLIICVGGALLMGAVDASAPVAYLCGGLAAAIVSTIYHIE